MAGVALVTGGGGLVGRHVVAELARDPARKVLVLSRRRPEALPDGVRHLAADLLDTASLDAVMPKLRPVTHVFHAALLPDTDPARESDINEAMLAHLLDALGRAGAPLRHVAVSHGAKWYGSHLGAYRTPAREDDPSHMPPNFYIAQQRLLERRAPEEGWGWSTYRPGIVFGYCLGNPMNMLTVLAGYALICRELGLPLRYPGTESGFRILNQATDAGLLARMMAWGSKAPVAHNQAYNVTNGDSFRWCDIWEGIADFFGMRPGGVQTLRLATQMADKAPVWDRIVERHSLRRVPLAQLANWTFADFIFHRGYDQILSMVKGWRHGFEESMDSEDAIFARLEELRALRIVP